MDRDELELIVGNSQLNLQKKDETEWFARVLLFLTGFLTGLGLGIALMCFYLAYLGVKF